jgi:radical SAM protein with 4Fe4S-binding SPASM domain
MLDVFAYQRIINQFSPNTTFLTLYFQGEPLLHPDFAELVRIADQKGIFTSTSTNGHLLAKREIARKIIQSGLKHLIISVDGTTQETYEKYRKNGNLQQVLDGIRNITEMKKELKSKTPFVEIQFLVMRHNEHQIPEIKRLAKDLNKLTFKSVQIYNIDKSDLLPANKKYNRYRQNADGTLRIKRRFRNRCWRQWSSVVIACNGDVVPCCFDKNAKYAFGNVFEKPLKEIWYGKKANDFRRAILTNRGNIDICCNCSEK